MKRRLVYLFVFVLACCLAACSSKPSTDMKTVEATMAEKIEEHNANLDAIRQKIESIAEKTSADAASEASTEEAAEPSETVEGKKPIDATGNLFSDGTVSDNLLEMQFILDNVLYSLPQTYSNLLNYGWEGEVADDLLLEARQEKWVSMTKGESTISVGVYNTDHSEAVPMSDCLVIGIDVAADELEGMDFTIAKGITLSSTWQEVAEAFGEDENASDREEDDTAVDFLYILGSGISVEMSFDNEYPEDNTISFYFDLDA